MDTKLLRQKILDLAIRGKLVPQDPNDEPASVLLERIKAEKEQLVKDGKIKRSKKTADTSDSRHYPFELPSGWVWTTLGELFTLQAGKNISAKEISIVQNKQNNYPCFGGNGIRGYVTSFNISGSHPIIGRQGALCGNINLATNEFYATEHAVVVDFYCETDLMWCYYTLKALNLNQYATATAQPGLAVKVINEAFIPLPPYKEQRKISNAISHWFSLIDDVNSSKVQLKNAISQVKSKILNLAIHGKLVSQDPADEPASELLKRVNPSAEITCDNEHYPQLPVGWCIAPMKLLCSLGDGVKEENIERFNIDVKFLRGEREAKTINNGRYIEAKSLLILVDGENSGEVFRTPIDGYQGSTFKRLAITEYMCEEFLLNVISSHRKVLRENKVGSAIPHLNKKLFKEIVVPIPPFNEQLRIVTAIKTLFNCIDNIAENL